MEERPYIMEGPAGTEVIINGKQYLYFAGTGYFSLQTNAELIDAANQASLKFGIGSATSRSMAGTTTLLMNLEECIAGFFGSEDAVSLPSGYLSNLAGLKALNELDLFDTIFMDEGSHYSLTEGAMAVGKPLVKFKHLDLDDLKLKLVKASEEHLRPLIATDGLFPVMAKLAPLHDYLELAEKYNGLIWVDDAHGVGILGENGRGTFEHLGINSPRLFMGATLSKAFGAFGGVIPGHAKFIRQVRNGTVLTGSSPPMNAAIAAGIKGLKIVKENPEMREMLRENAQYLKAGLRSGLKSKNIIMDDNSLPIVAIKYGGASAMSNIQQALMKDGIFIQYTSYQGAGEKGVLRMVVFSTHTKAQIDRLIRSLIKNIPLVTP